MLLPQRIPPRPFSAPCSPRSLHFRSWFVFVPIGNMRHEPILSTSLKHRPVSALEVPRRMGRLPSALRRVFSANFLSDVLRISFRGGFSARDINVGASPFLRLFPRAPSPSPFFPLDYSFWPIHRRLLALQYATQPPPPKTDTNQTQTISPATTPRTCSTFIIVAPPMIFRRLGSLAPACIHARATFAIHSLRRNYARSSRDPVPVPAACVAKFPLAAHLVPLTDGLGSATAAATVNVNQVSYFTAASPRAVHSPIALASVPSRWLPPRVRPSTTRKISRQSRAPFPVRTGPVSPPFGTPRLADAPREAERLVAAAYAEAPARTLSFSALPRPPPQDIPPLGVPAAPPPSRPPANLIAVHVPAGVFYLLIRLTSRLGSGIAFDFARTLAIPRFSLRRCERASECIVQVVAATVAVVLSTYASLRPQARRRRAAAIRLLRPSPASRASPLYYAAATPHSPPSIPNRRMTPTPTTRRSSLPPPPPAVVVHAHPLEAPGTAPETSARWCGAAHDVTRCWVGLVRRRGLEYGGLAGRRVLRGAAVACARAWTKAVRVRGVGQRPRRAACAVPHAHDRFALLVHTLQYAKARCTTSSSQAPSRRRYRYRCLSPRWIRSGARTARVPLHDAPPPPADTPSTHIGADAEAQHGTPTLPAPPFRERTRARRVTQEAQLHAHAMQAAHHGAQASLPPPPCALTRTNTPLRTKLNEDGYGTLMELESGRAEVHAPAPAPHLHPPRAPTQRALVLRPETGEEEGAIDAESVSAPAPHHRTLAVETSKPRAHTASVLAARRVWLRAGCHAHLYEVLQPGDGRPAHPGLEDGGSLTVDHLPPVGVEVLRQLTSLTLLSARSPHQIVPAEHLPPAHIIPNLIHLTVCAPKWLTTRETPLPIVPTVPFTGTEFVAHAILCGSRALVSLTTDDAVDLVERANILTLCDLELSMMKCDDEVLLTFAHRLAAARSLKVSFRFSQPTKVFICTRCICLRDPKPAPSEFCRDGEGMVLGRMRVPKDARVAAVEPADDACGEALAAWTLYNQDLRAVRSARGREWARHAAAGRRGVESVGGVEIIRVSFPTMARRTAGWMDGTVIYM
ncbi:hypothetical protein FB451DRAFT_1507264 [Mycena latifolia]|nr:hypothetical protein FB451DRAFT_1507264 [Mycena latifolia]